MNMYIEVGPNATRKNDWTSECLYKWIEE